MLEDFEIQEVREAIDTMVERHPDFLERHAATQEVLALGGSVEQHRSYTFGTIRGCMDRDPLPSKAAEIIHLLLTYSQAFYSSSVLSMLEDLHSGE